MIFPTDAIKMIKLFLPDFLNTFNWFQVFNLFADATVPDYQVDGQPFKFIFIRRLFPFKLVAVMQKDGPEQSQRR